MKTRNFTRIFVLSIIGISLSSCKIEKVILHRDIKGTVTDAETSKPVYAAKVELSSSDCKS
jgi:hypothetical protein